MKTNFIVVLAIVFVLTTLALFGVQLYFPTFSFPLLLGGNILMALLCMLSYALVKKQLRERPQAFVRGVYSGTFIKLFACMAALVIYVIINRPHVHKPSIFILFGVYAVYTIVETMYLSKLARSAK